MSTNTELDLICNCRKGAMDDKQFKATVQINLETYAQQLVKKQLKKIRRELRAVYFDTIILTCSECKGIANSCGGCGGTRRPSNADAGQPLSEYIKTLILPANNK